METPLPSPDPPLLDSEINLFIAFPSFVQVEPGWLSASQLRFVVIYLISLRLSEGDSSAA